MNAFTISYVLKEKYSSKNCKDISFEQETKFLRSNRSPIVFFYISYAGGLILKSESDDTKKAFNQLLFENICYPNLLRAISCSEVVANFLEDSNAPLKLSK